MELNMFSTTSTGSTSQPCPAVESIFTKAQAGIQLMDAVRTGDLKAAKICIEQNTDPPNPNCTLPIESCVNCRNKLIVNCLVKDNNGTELTPLIMAIYAGKLDIARYLVEEKKCELDMQNDIGITALYASAQMGNLLAVQYLLEQGADVNKTTDNGASPFLIAAQMGHLDVLKCLREKGADVNKSMRTNGWGPLCVATSHGHLQVIQFLLDFCEVDVNKTLNDLLSPLYIAASAGRLELVQCLLAHNANVNLADFNGASPLFAAALGGHPTVVDCLLKKGANVNQANKSGVTPLDIAIQGSQSSGERAEAFLQVIKSLNDQILKQQYSCDAEPVTKRPRLKR